MANLGRFMSVMIVTNDVTVGESLYLADDDTDTDDNDDDDM